MFTFTVKSQVISYEKALSLQESLVTSSMKNRQIVEEMCLIYFGGEFFSVYHFFNQNPKKMNFITVFHNLCFFW